MSDLQISLLGIGALIVVGVILFNRWQENKLKRKLHESFDKNMGDALLQEPAYSPEGRIEPSVGSMDSADVAPADTSENHSPPEPAYSEPVLNLKLPVDMPDDQPAQSTLAAELDPAIEFIVRLHPGEPVHASSLADVAEATGEIGKPVHWVGLNAATQSWEVVDPQGHAAYADLAVGIQLTDRSGPVTEAQLEVFCEVLQGFASKELAVMECPDRQQAVQKASELDQFCLDVDVLIGLNVVSQSGSVFPGTKIRGLAEAFGMSLQPEGVFHYVNDQGVSLFTLCNHESEPFSADILKSVSTHGVTLLFDVPRVPDGLAVFDEMTMLGHKLAQSLGGTLVDDNIRPLSDAGIDKIRQQLARIYQKMEAQQIPSGSTRALKLFA